VVADDQVFAVDVTGRVFAFDARSGVTEWDHALNDTSSLSTFLVTPEHVLVTTDAGVVHAIDRGTGHLRSSLDVGGSFVRGLADAGEVLVAVDGVEDARVLALAPDPDGVLVDEPSPTTVGVGRMLAGFALGGLGVAAIVVLLARPLQRRLGPPAGTDAGPGGDAEGVG
jgi:outer membrane protein assembly factor BamB